jgi:hypothetical protein
MFHALEKRSSYSGKQPEFKAVFMFGFNVFKMDSPLLASFSSMLEDS